jgi:hypothetical protein
MSTHTAPKTDPHTTIVLTNGSRVPGIGLDLAKDGEPILTAEGAVEFAEATGFAFLPRQPETDDGRWVCDVPWEAFLTLVSVGWLGVEVGPFSAETEWG